MFFFEKNHPISGGEIGGSCGDTVNLVNFVNDKWLVK